MDHFDIPCCLMAVSSLLLSHNCPRSCAVRFLYLHDGHRLPDQSHTLWPVIIYIVYIHAYVCTDHILAV